MKNKKLVQTILAVALLTLAVAITLMLIGNKMKADSIKEEQEAEQAYNWLVENCECLERERVFCEDDFILKGSWCYNPVRNATASRRIGCSKYECSEGIKLWNNETNLWEDAN